MVKTEKHKEYLRYSFTREELEAEAQEMACADV